MNRRFTRYLMIASAVFTFSLGVLLTFAPAEILRATGGGTGTPWLILTEQACGALYLGFAILNWMAKDNLIGGIYSRPVAMGNFLHCFAVAMALLKSFPSLPRSAAAYALIAIYLLLTAAFASVLFRHPKSN